MGLEVKRFSHTISLGAYPRAWHNFKWCRSICKKFSNLISKRPILERSYDKNELKFLNDFTKLEDVLRVHVIGKTDINDELLKVKPKFANVTKEYEEGMAATDLAIYICYLQISDVDTERFQKEVTEVFNFLNSLTVMNEGMHDSLLIVLDFGDKMKQMVTAYETFVATTQARAKIYFGTELPNSGFVSGTGEIGNSISQWIESTYITEKLERVQNLRVYCSGNKSSENIDIVRSDEFVATLQGFLTNGHSLADMMQDAGTSPFIDLLLKYLKRVVRCALVKLTSTKHGLPEYVCNSLAHEYSLEEKFINAISINTKYKLKQMETDCQAAYDAKKHNDKYYKFPQKHSYKCSCIIHDIENLVAEFEENILPVKKTASDQLKLIFEIDALLQRIVPRQKIAGRVTYDMFKQLSKLDYVFGVGTIYGSVEIHVLDCDISKARKDIAEIFHLMDFREPFRIKTIVDMPKPLFRQGAALRSNVVINNETLGCFLTPENGTDLYAISCAHMFANSADQLDVSLVTNGNLAPFATSSPNLRILRVNPQTPIIDFAALKVKKEVQAQCNPMLGDEDGNLRNGMLLSQEEVNVGSPVYKYGAGSGFSKGIVSSIDYYMRDADEGEQLILIEPENDQSYATNGDSRAVNCMTFFDEHDEFVGVISVISNGGFRLEGDTSPTCVSFPFALPLREISRRANLNLRFVRQ